LLPCITARQRRTCWLPSALSGARELRLTVAALDKRIAEIEAKLCERLPSASGLAASMNRCTAPGEALISSGCFQQI
jgi:hypothetical protein